jgi:hypothetical protein
MGIDRIGKNGPPAPVPEAAGPSGVRPANGTFDVPAATAPHLDAAGSASQAEPVARGALERFRAGEMDLGGYVDAKVHEATAHLSALPPAELEGIRSALRQRLASEPTLIDLLHTATGEELPPLDD